MYRDRNTGVGLFQIPSIDISVIIAMFILIVMAWGVSRMERSMVQAPKLIPVFTISQELAVTPAAETATKKGAARVGGFMSLANSAAIPAVKTDAAAAAKADVLGKIVLTESAPTGAAILPPKVIYKSIPDYPAKAIEQGLQGTVMVEVYILKNGRVGEATIDQSSGYQVLDKSALAAISQWIFEPATYAREVTEARFKVPVRFQLKP